MSEIYIGLISGTSVDAVDAVVADFEPFPPRLVASHSQPIEPSLKQRILDLCNSGNNEIERMGRLDRELGHVFAEAAIAVAKRGGVRLEQISAIGSHGQTIRHEPEVAYPFTLQIGDPNTIVQQTGIITVADFRRRDLAVGGQGAPLAPAYHRWMLQGRAGVVVNIGGMSNVTLLPINSEEPVVGFDTGPGNVLLDDWMFRTEGETFDCDGAFARSGRVVEPLLELLRSDPFFSLQPPKSTGRETFNRAWFDQRYQQIGQQRPEDVAATLVELTASTIADAIHDCAAQSLWVCGGGAHNRYLLERLSAHLSGWEVDTSATIGMEPDWVEAMAFAWLARETLSGRTGNLPEVTGADRPVILGAIYPA